MTEDARLARNAALLAECDPIFADRVRRILQQLEGDGYRPRCQDAYRTAEEQARLFALKRTQVQWSFHQATTADGRPESLAIHLLDDDHPITPSMKYLLKLAAFARQHLCQTGILWGLVPSAKGQLQAAIDAGRWTYIGPRGWDPLHVEPVDLTIAEAKRGLRLRDLEGFHRGERRA